MHGLRAKNSSPFRKTEDEGSQGWCPTQISAWGAPWRGESYEFLLCICVLIRWIYS